MSAFQYATITSHAVEQLHQSITRALPNEACGLLMGRCDASGIHIEYTLPIRNIAADPQHHFELDAQQWIPYLLNDSLMIGLYHSHPVSSPTPSAEDYVQLQQFGSLFSVYMIAGTCSGRLFPEYRLYRFIATPHDVTAWGLTPLELTMA